MTHSKKTLAHTELKFRLGSANPRWIFNLGWKFRIFHIIDIFSNPDWKFYITHARTPCLFLQKHKNFTRTFEMRRWQTYRPYKMFTRIWKSHGFKKLQLKLWESQIVYIYKGFRFSLLQLTSFLLTFFCFSFLLAF